MKAAISVALADRKVDDPGQRSTRRSSGYEPICLCHARADVIARLVEMDAESITPADLEKDWTDETTPKAVKMKVLVRLLDNHPPAERAVKLKAMAKAKFRAIYRIWPDFEVRTRITRSISTVKANAAINSFAARGTNSTGRRGPASRAPSHFKLAQEDLDPASRSIAIYSRTAVRCGRNTRQHVVAYRDMDCATRQEGK